jgi:hypothetical protein
MHRTHAAAVELLTHALVRPASGVVPQAERSNRNPRSNCKQRGVHQVQGQVNWVRLLERERVDRLLGCPVRCRNKEHR